MTPTTTDPQAAAAIATARQRWIAYLAEMGIDPTQPQRLDRAELAEYLSISWPGTYTARTIRLAFDYQHTAAELEHDLAGQRPTGYFLADQVDAAALAERRRIYGGDALDLFQ